jgi:hypothetical protein
MERVGCSIHPKRAIQFSPVASRILAHYPESQAWQGVPFSGGVMEHCNMGDIMYLTEHEGGENYGRST